MQSFNSVSEALFALRSAAFNPPKAMPPEVAEKLAQVASEVSPVTAIVEAAELLFARRDELEPELLHLAAGLASFATEHGWHGLASDERGTGLVRALRRGAGEEAPSGKWPDAPSDPAVMPRFEKAIEEQVSAEAAAELEPIAKEWI